MPKVKMNLHIPTIDLQGQSVGCREEVQWLKCHFQLTFSRMHSCKQTDKNSRLEHMKLATVARKTPQNHRTVKPAAAAESNQNCFP